MAVKPAIPSTSWAEVKLLLIGMAVLSAAAVFLLLGVGQGAGLLVGVTATYLFGFLGLGAVVALAIDLYPGRGNGREQDA